jgi:hypothetical protein
MKDKQRKPKTQSGFASFSMHELAELITKPIQDDKERMVVDEPIKSKQNELQNTRTSREVR